MAAATAGLAKQKVRCTCGEQCSNDCNMDQLAGACEGIGAESLLRGEARSRQHSPLRNGRGCPPRSFHRPPPQLQCNHTETEHQIICIRTRITSVTNNTCHNGSLIVNSIKHKSRFSRSSSMVTGKQITHAQQSRVTSLYASSPKQIPKPALNSTHRRSWMMYRKMRILLLTQERLMKS